MNPIDSTEIFTYRHLFGIILAIVHSLYWLEDWTICAETAAHSGVNASRKNRNKENIESEMPLKA